MNVYLLGTEVALMAAAAQMICRPSPDPSDDPIKIPLAVNKRRQTRGPNAVYYLKKNKKRR